MPTLSSKSIVLPAGSFQELSLLNESFSRAIELQLQPFIQVQEAMENLFQPIIQIQKTMEIMVEPIRRMQEIIESSLTLQAVTIVTEMVEMVESHQKAITTLVASPLFNLPKLTDLGVFPSYINGAEIIDGELQDEPSPKEPVYMQQMQAVAIPQSWAIPVTPSIPRYKTKSRMGLKQISGGNFSYKRTVLKGISLRNREGKLLGFLLGNPHLFISDELMQEKFFTKDILDQSQIFKLLKNKFKQNGLKTTIKRQGDGYILLNIHYLQ